MTVSEADMVNAFIAKHGVKKYHENGITEDKHGRKYDIVREVATAVPTTARNSDKIFTIDEAAEYLGLGVKATMSYVKQQRLHFIKERSAFENLELVHPRFLKEHLDVFLIHLNSTRETTQTA